MLYSPSNEHKTLNNPNENVHNYICMHKTHTKTGRRGNSRMAHSGALWDVDGVGVVEELRGPQAYHYGH